MDKLLLAGGIVVSAVSLILYSVSYITLWECLSHRYSLCVTFHPTWPLLIMPIGLALVALSFVMKLSTKL